MYANKKLFLLHSYQLYFMNIFHVYRRKKKLWGVEENSEIP